MTLTLRWNLQAKGRFVHQRLSPLCLIIYYYYSWFIKNIQISCHRQNYIEFTKFTDKTIKLQTLSELGLTLKQGGIKKYTGIQKLRMVGSYIQWNQTC